MGALQGARTGDLKRYDVVLRRLPLPERGLSADLRDRDYAKRMWIALAIALSLHEVVAGLWPRSGPPPTREVASIQEIVTITKRPKPTPTPRPTPRMTPAPRYTLAPVFAVKAPAAKAASTPHAAIGGAAARKRVVTVKPKPVPAKAPPVSLVAGTHLGKQNGGTGTGAGAGNGTSGLAGTGSGTGTTGNGNGGDKNSAPCADIYILPGRTDYAPDGTVLQYVYAKVILKGGDVEIGKFPYPFKYAGEKLNPFSHDDQLTADKGVPVQQPPAGSDVTSMPPMVQFVLKYTSPATGFTQLPDCGGSGSGGALIGAPSISPTP